MSRNDFRAGREEVVFGFCCFMAHAGGRRIVEELSRNRYLFPLARGSVSIRIPALKNSAEE